MRCRLAIAEQDRPEVKIYKLLAPRGQKLIRLGLILVIGHSFVEKFGTSQRNRNSKRDELYPGRIKEFRNPG